MLTHTAPKDLAENRDYRAWLSQRCQSNRRVREHVLERCGHDLLWFINSWAWQFNPDKSDEEVAPFVTFPFQDGVLLRTEHRWLTLRDDVVWEKSRKQGATWKALFIAAQKCLFRRRKTFIAISHSQDAVHRAADPNTLFWKFQFLLDHLPDWMTRGAIRRKLTFDFPATHSSLNGMATTERSGVGGRGPLIVDEFGLYRDDRAILGNTADVGPRLFISTHYGLHTAFWDLCQRPDLHKEVMHWTQHPEQNRGRYRPDPVKNMPEVIDKTYSFPADYRFVLDGTPLGGPEPGVRSPWYDRECSRRQNARDVAAHLDINPGGSQSQFFDPLKLRRVIDASVCPPFWEGDLEFDPDAAKPVRLKRYDGGPLKLWINPTGECEVAPGKYASGNDVATEMGASNSVCSMGNALTGLKVAEYVTCSSQPADFARMVVALCRLFKDYDGQGALLNWEAAGPGLQFGKTVLGLAYRRLFYRETMTLSRVVTPSNIPGWSPNPSAKRALLDGYKVSLVSRAFVNRSEYALKECAHYRYSDTKDAVEHPQDVGGSDPSGARSNHGDRVIADALCWLAMQRLGAGRPLATRDELLVPAAVGTMEWRAELHKQKDRTEQDRRPIKRRTA